MTIERLKAENAQLSLDLINSKKEVEIAKEKEASHANLVSNARTASMANEHQAQLNQLKRETSMGKLRKVIEHIYKLRMVASFSKWSRMVTKGGDSKEKDLKIRVLEQ